MLKKVIGAARSESDENAMKANKANDRRKMCIFVGQISVAARGVECGENND